jgi:hypothetical protein
VLIRQSIYHVDRIDLTARRRSRLGVAAIVASLRLVCEATMVQPNGSLLTGIVCASNAAKSGKPSRFDCAWYAKLARRSKQLLAANRDSLCQ